MMKSIIQDEADRCYLCGRNGRADPLEEHHVFGGPYRKKSELYGLKVYLCGNRCHRDGPEVVHKSRAEDRALKAEVQELAMDCYDWDVDQFREVFGKNYL